jgi:hypothetical protein
VCCPDRDAVTPLEEIDDVDRHIISLIKLDMQSDRVIGAADTGGTIEYHGSHLADVRERHAGNHPTKGRLKMLKMPARHIYPKPYVGVREDEGEASVGACAGRATEPRKLFKLFGRRRHTSGGAQHGDSRKLRGHSRPGVVVEPGMR